MNAYPLNLSKREQEVAAKVSEGLLNKEIADKLCISEYTVKHHLVNIFVKTGCTNRWELALRMLQYGPFLKPEGSV